MSFPNIMRYLRRSKEQPEPAPGPDGIRKAHWEAEDRRKDQLARMMRRERYGPELTRDQEAAILSEQARRIGNREQPRPQGAHRW